MFPLRFPIHLWNDALQFYMSKKKKKTRDGRPRAWGSEEITTLVRHAPPHQEATVQGLKRRWQRYAASLETGESLENKFLAPQPTQPWRRDRKKGGGTHCPDAEGHAAVTNADRQDGNIACIRDY